MKETKSLTTPAAMKQQMIDEGLLSLVPGGEKKVDEVLTSLRLAMAESSKLQDCLKTPSGQASLYNAVRKAVRTGLSLNPQEGKAAVIPYNAKSGVTVQYQIMKNGLIELAMQTGQIEIIDVDVVRENDVFTIKKTGTGDDYEFSPARKSRGKIDGFFAVVKLKDGGVKISYMSTEEINEHREQFSARSEMPEIGYGKKTVLKMCLRDLALSSVDEAIGLEEGLYEKSTDLEVEFAPAEPAPRKKLTPEKIKKASKEKEIGVHEEAQPEIF